ncbi:MAG TPA: ABC transporter permease [Lachnospiraceae bacterium]|nr:ABC transporter permease [Lachnospiraceae bacterium]
MNKEKGIVKYFKDITQDAQMVRLFVIMVAAFVIMAAANGDKFLSLSNFQSMARTFPEVGILAIAVSLAMLLGGINLSVVGIANLSGIFCCKFIIAAQEKIGMWPSIFIGLAIAMVVGALCGLLNGFLIAYVGIPAMLATLGSQEIFTGLGVGVTKGAAVFGTPSEFTFFGGAYIFGVIPMSLILFVIVVVVFTILLQRKQYGMELYLVGTNPKSARFSGIKNERVILKTHVYGGILSAIAGIIIASGTNSAKASYGSSYVLRCLIVAILGGINPSGGFGKITGVVMAVLTIQFLSSGFGILRVDSYFQTFVWGAVLVGDMILNHYMDKLAENRKKKKAEKETAA